MGVINKTAYYVNILLLLFISKNSFLKINFILFLFLKIIFIHYPFLLYYVIFCDSSSVFLLNFFSDFALVAFLFFLHL